MYTRTHTHTHTHTHTCIQIRWAEEDKERKATEDVKSQLLLTISLAPSKALSEAAKARREELEELGLRERYSAAAAFHTASLSVCLSVCLSLSLSRARCLSLSLSLSQYI